ncbi:DUF4956 domain-containing protein [Alkalibaculum bacchi]|uniref:DUF4956 domain-containing protein n=1 Tax=Alkalibaculum bacchi TaxID=645887 RepID=UPI0026EA1A45|nr:DUF4956 domain-containing protein [Alkalibaculum bacchi]
MKEFIVNNLSSAETISMATIVLNNIVAMAVAFFLMFVYKLTYSGTAYSKNFNISLGAIAIITNIIMSVISNNIALSLGMVGALSIIRFRTAVKDVRDAAFIFWGISVGIGCGVSQYALVGIGSLFVFLFFFIMGQASLDSRYLLIVEGISDVQNEIEAAVDSHFGRDISRAMKSISGETCELIYIVKENVMKKANEKNLIDISQRLNKIKGVKRVNIVEQLDEIGR